MIKVTNLSHHYQELAVLEQLSLEFPKQQITAILGPSGCGKTTLLHLLAGLMKPQQGEVTSLTKLSYLFQEPRLLPWLTVRENIALVLETELSRQELELKVNQVLKATGLMNYAAYYPAQLSGGLKQRVAMARAFAYPAPVLLMDEPFKSLDLKMRFQLMKDFLQLWEEEPRTVIMVTHEIKEAVFLGRQILLFSEKPVQTAKQYWIENEYATRFENEQLLRLEQELFMELVR